MVEAEREFHFTDGLHAFPPEGLDEGAVRLNAGGDDHQVRTEGAPVFLRGGGVQRNVFRPVADGGGGVKHAHAGAVLHG